MRSEICHIDTVEDHGKKYIQARNRIDLKKSNIDEIDEIRKYLSENRLNCFKYHYALDETVQNLPCIKAFIEVSADCNFIKIINRKPNVAVKYVQVPDLPDDILKKQYVIENKEY